MDVPVHGDVAATCEALMALVEDKSNRDFLDDMLVEQEKNLNHVVEAYTKKHHQRTPIHPEYLADIIDTVADEDAVFTADTGMCNVWHARYINPNGKRKLLASFRHGTMANAFPQAIGAQFADRDRQVIAMCGDGGIGMLLGELLTAKLHDLPMKVVVFNNSSLGMVKLEMMVAGLPDFGTDHEHVNYADIANAAGMKGYRVERPEDIEPTLREAFAHPGPVLVDVVTDPNALSIPPEISLEQVAGFSRAAVETVLEGGVGKMVDLARSNLRNVPRLSGFKGL